MRYENFSLTFSSAGEGRFLTRVLDSPAGQASGDFILPFANSSLRRGSEAAARRNISKEEGKVEISQSSRPEEIGSLLFNALFTGDIAQLFFQSLGYVTAKGDRRLRLIIRVNPNEEGAASITSLPWELLYYNGTHKFLAFDLSISIVRYLEVQQPITSTPLPSRIQLLLITFNPRETPTLELKGERRRIQSAVSGSLHPFALTTVQQATIDELCRATRESPFHVIHFSGHGEIDSESGEPFLALEDEKGSTARLSARMLYSILSPLSTLRLVVLNSCLDQELTLGSTVSLASYLSMQGIPAVIAHQSAINDIEAIAFSQSFYEALARGKCLDEALSEGRLAIRAQFNDYHSWTWATPVLFSRLPSNELFEGDD